MIGIIVTGHGHYPSGLKDGMEMIAGKQEWLEAVDFTDSTDLRKELSLLFSKMAGLDGILVLADLMGGSPFQTAVMLAREVENIEVVAGASQGMLLEVLGGRDMDVYGLAVLAEQAGRQSVRRFPKKRANE